MKKSKIILMLIMAFGLTKTVYGAGGTIKMYYTYYNDVEDGNNRIQKTIGGKTTYVDLIKIAGDQEYIGYCVDVGANLATQEPVQTVGDLATYLNTTLNNASKSQSLAKKINEYIYFGYGYSNHKSQNYYAATQKLIWEELYKNGYRQNYYEENVPFSYGSTYIALNDEENSIKASITAYYQKPSLCSSSSKLELAKGETKSYTDTNGVLANYKVTCSSGLTCTTNGNELKITANQASSGQKVSFTKGGSETYPVVYRNGTDQGVAVSTGSIGPVSCEFGVDSYENVQTSGSIAIVVISIGLIAAIMSYAIYITKKESV